MDVRLYRDSVVVLHFNITNRCVGALVDMDTAVSCCALSFPRRLLPTYKSQMLPTDECFSTADGESFTPVGIITLHFTIGSLTLNEKFYIFPQDSSYPDLDSFPYSPGFNVVTRSVAQAARETAAADSYKPHSTSGSGADSFGPAQACSQTPRTRDNAQLSGSRSSNSTARPADLTSMPVHERQGRKSMPSALAFVHQTVAHALLTPHPDTLWQPALIASALTNRFQIMLLQLRPHQDTARTFNLIMPILTNGYLITPALQMPQ